MKDNNVLMNVEIPANTFATIYIPTSNKDDIKENNKVIALSDDVKIDRVEDGYTVLRAGSGIYHFSFTKGK